jgi:hypothetical protein
LEINLLITWSVEKAEACRKEILETDINIVKHIPGIFFRSTDIWLINARFFQVFKFTKNLFKPL